MLVLRRSPDSSSNCFNSSTKSISFSSRYRSVCGLLGVVVLSPPPQIYLLSSSVMPHAPEITVLILLILLIPNFAFFYIVSCLGGLDAVTRSLKWGPICVSLTCYPNVCLGFCQSPSLCVFACVSHAPIENLRCNQGSSTILIGLEIKKVND